LKGAGKAQSGARRRPQPGDVLAPEADSALLRPVEAGDAVEQRGLAGAVGADHGRDRAFRYLEAHIAERCDAAEGQVDVDGLKNIHSIPNVRCFWTGPTAGLTAQQRYPRFCLARTGASPRELTLDDANALSRKSPLLRFAPYSYARLSQALIPCR